VKHLLCMLALVVATSLDGRAQGFDWQYSARYPTSSQTQFIGASLSAGYALHQGSLPYIEQDLEQALACCTYERGTGIPLAFGITYEQWLPSDLAVYGVVGYRMMTASMTAPPTEPEPLSDGRLLVTQYEYDATLHYLDLTGGIRYRFDGTHFTIGAGLRLQALAGSSATHVHRVLSPSDYSFTTNPPSREKEIPTTGVSDAAGFVAVPFLSVGYDISIMRGVYLSPLITVGLPLMSTAATATWQTTDVGLMIRLYRAL
jgi:hypothetical protein